MRMPSLDLDLLQAFVAVAEQRSFTRAAVHLHRTQPAVSMQVQRLEARVGTRLLRRTRSEERGNIKSNDSPEFPEGRRFFLQRFTSS